MFQVESFSLTRICAVLARSARIESFNLTTQLTVNTSFFGVILVSSGDYDSAPSSPFQSLGPSSNPTLLKRPIADRNPLLGDSLALLSAIFYALYVVLLKSRVGSEARMDMQLFFGFVGVINICCTWTMGLVLHFTGVENLDVPSSRRQWGGVLLNVRSIFALWLLVP